MPIELLSWDAHILNMRLRMPFRFGIANLTICPHLFFRMEMAIDGQRVHGMAADHLPMKWLTKNPNTSYEDDLKDMMEVVRTAARHAMAVRRGATVFDLWSTVYDRQAEWGRQNQAPPLLCNFGTTLVERAMIEAYCRATGIVFGDAVRQGKLGFDLARLSREKLGSAEPWQEKIPLNDLLPAKPLRAAILRHTVGLGDYLSEADIPAAERINDGLPQSLEACISAYGLTHFKIKLSGDIVRDTARLKRISEIIENQAGEDYAITLDGNENFHELKPFKTLWQGLTTDPSLTRFLSKLIFVEQPLHRDVALTTTVTSGLQAWRDRPPMIIDESDSSFSALRDALTGGYIGTSHKNCKGVFKGLAAAATIAYLQQGIPQGQYQISCEDLSNIGPVALQQDLAAAATMGIDNIERNSQHYFKGLSMLPEVLATQVQTAHPDLYHRHPRGFVTLNVNRGRIGIGSTIDAPFGVGFQFDPGQFTPMDQWKYASMEG